VEFVSKNAINLNEELLLYFTTTLLEMAIMVAPLEKGTVILKQS